MSKSIKIIIKNSTVIINKNAKFNYPNSKKLLNTKKQENTVKKTREIYKTKVPPSLYEDDDDYYQEILEKIIRNGGL